jgi:hypothetical protein
VTHRADKYKERQAFPILIGTHPLNPRGLLLRQVNMLKLVMPGLTRHPVLDSRFRGKHPCPVGHHEGMKIALGSNCKTL